MNRQALVFAKDSVVNLQPGSLIWLKKGTVNGADQAVNMNDNKADLRVDEFGRFDLRGMREISFGGLLGTGYIINSNNIGSNTITIGRGVAAGQTHTFEGTLTRENNAAGGVGNDTLDPKAPLNLVKVGDGTQIFTGNLVPTTLTVSSGKVVIADGTALAFKAATCGTITVEANGSLVFDRSTALSVTNAVAGSGAIRKQGTGTVTLANAATFTGALSVEDGTLALGGDSTVTDATVIGGALKLDAVLAATNEINVSSGGALVVTGTGKVGSTTDIMVYGGTLTTVETGKLFAEVSAIPRGQLFLQNSTLEITGTLELNTEGSIDFNNIEIDFTRDANGLARLIVHAGSLSSNGPVNLHFDGDLTDNGSALLIIGVNEGTLKNWSIDGTVIDGNYVLADDSSGFRITAIPEPSTYALFGGLGAVALALLRRRVRRG